MEIRLYNNLHRRLEAFSPLDPGRVTMYLCGPTVYNYVHVGNARGPVVFDVLARLLRRRYPRLLYARNITDVDDKINNAAKELGVPIGEITAKYTAAYRADMLKLGVVPQDVEPHATEHIAEIINMIGRLIASGHAYAADSHVLFSVASFADYGTLSRRPPDEMLAGARVEVAPYKRDPGDFVLWKPSTPDLPGWDSPWGIGRPGWHIECSAMAEAHLGETIDIHAGGLDLQFPHHENELAQSTCVHGGKVFARFWLHNGMLNFGGSKMSKSLGNVSVLHELLEQQRPETLRYALLSAQYRQPLDWSEGLIEQSRRTLDRLYGTLRELQDVEVSNVIEIPTEVEELLCDDLNTPAVLAELAEIASQARKAETDSERRRLKEKLLGAGLALGLLQGNPEAWFTGTEREADIVTAIRMRRRIARAARDFETSDVLRGVLSKMGVELKDRPDGTEQAIFTAEVTETIQFRDAVVSHLIANANASDSLRLDAAQLSVEKLRSILESIDKDKLLGLFRSALAAHEKSKKEA